jgi:hypothetical protein
MDPPECSGHSHDHDHGDELGVSLRKYVNMEGVQCRNEVEFGSGKLVLKLHEERLTSTPSVQSPDGDPELLFFIPFTEAVSVQSITVRNGSENSDTVSPRTIKLFVDRDDLDFETARELPPAATLELLPPEHGSPEGTIDYPLRPASKFANIASISVFVVDNYDASGESGTEITYIGFKGKGMGVRRKAVETVYEAQGMPQDHKVPDLYGAPNVL